MTILNLFIQSCFYFGESCTLYTVLDSLYFIKTTIITLQKIKRIGRLMPTRIILFSIQAFTTVLLLVINKYSKVINKVSIVINKVSIVINKNSNFTLYSIFCKTVLILLILFLQICKLFEINIFWNSRNQGRKKTPCPSKKRFRLLRTCT